MRAVKAGKFRWIFINKVPARCGVVRFAATSAKNSNLIEWLKITQNRWAACKPLSKLQMDSQAAKTL